MNEQFSMAFEADEAIPQYSRVKLDADGKITIAGLTDEGIGFAGREAFAAGETINVELDGRVAFGIAIEAFDAGARLYTEAAGKVQDTAASTAFPVGVALESAGADGDQVRYMVKPGAEANS